MSAQQVELAAARVLVVLALSGLLRSRRVQAELARPPPVRGPAVRARGAGGQASRSHRRSEPRGHDHAGAAPLRCQGPHAEPAGRGAVGLAQHAVHEDGGERSRQGRAIRSDAQLFFSGREGPISAERCDELMDHWIEMPLFLGICLGRLPFASCIRCSAVYQTLWGC